MNTFIKEDLSSVPTVQQLRQSGWQVRCLYSRLENGVVWRKSPNDIRKNYKYYLRPINILHGPYISSKGGKVVVELSHKDGRKAIGASLCSPVDFFEKKYGRQLALKRALQDIKQP